MRTEFHAELERLTAELGEMCGIAAITVRDATTALVHDDAAATHRVLTELGRLDALDRCVQRRAFSVLALQAPVAHDLRAVVSAFPIAADADRMGGLAAHIAMLRTTPDTADLFSEMCVCAEQFAERARRAVMAEDIDEAHHIETDDATMNDLHRALLARVLGGHWEYGAPAASEAVLLGRFYERFADHAVDIARKVVFQRIGKFAL